jgi:DNA polymerase-3 subunit epsilon
MLESIAAEQGLCWRQLGWEKRGGPCFARQVKKCRGACLGEETPEQHNLRLATALAPYRVNEWPWAGRVMIRESHPDGRFEEAHVFDRWCHLGTARSEDELAELATARAQIDFDPDIYKIVQTFAAKHPRRIKPLPSPQLEEALLS